VVPYVYNGKIIYVHDAGTYDVVLDLGFRITTKFRIKLADFEFPHYRSKDEDERSRAKRAKDCAMKLLLNRRVLIKSYLESGHWDKWTAELYLVGTNTALDWVKISSEGRELVSVSKYFSLLAENDYRVEFVDVDSLL